jgi:hypothetical protein
VDDWSKSVDKKIPVDIAVFDFSKAFDSVPHNLLLSKLVSYGIDDKLISWLSSFLLARRQRVVLEGCPSAWLPVTSGVPQGSVLGPLLFLIYIDDISAGLSSTVRLFADDLIMYSEIPNNSFFSNFQQDLNKLHDWSVKWEMNFNNSKCHITQLTLCKNTTKFAYKLGSFVLPYCNSFKYLGVTISSDLKWKSHINIISKKASNTLNFVRRNLYFCSQEYKSKAYLSLVRPILEYGSPAWDPYYNTDINSLNKVQNRASHFATNTYDYKIAVAELHKKLGWPLLQERRKVARLCEFYKIVKGTSPVPATELSKPTRLGRSSSDGYNYKNLYTRTNIRKFSFFPRTIIDWNLLPSNIKSSPSIDSFRSKATAHLFSYQTSSLSYSSFSSSSLLASSPSSSHQSSSLSSCHH